MFSRKHVTVVGGGVSTVRPGSQDGLWEAKEQVRCCLGCGGSQSMSTHPPEVLAFLIIPSTRVFHSGFGRTYI